MIKYNNTKIIMDLPFPTSVNGIWRGTKRSVHISAPYKHWKKLAGQEWLLQRKNQPRAISGRFKAILLLDPPSTQRRDLDNFIKVVLDFAVSMEVVEDDSFCRALYARWVSKGEIPMGCRLILKSHNR